MDDRLAGYRQAAFSSLSRCRVAIDNPASGPGNRVHPYIAAVITRARKAGVLTVAYVGTQYARQPLAAVKGEVDTYLRF